MKGKGSDPRLGILSGLSLMDPENKEREPYGSKAREELSEAHEAGRRAEGLDEGPDEDEDAEDGSDLSEEERDRLMGEIRRIRTKLDEVTSANIALNAKLVEAGGQIKALGEQLARLKADNPEIFGEDEDGDSE